MKIGYARVSTTKQDLTRQIDWLNSVGCERVFTDKISGKIKGNLRPGMSELLKTIRSGDSLYLDEMSRLGRTILETINTLHEILNKDVSIILNKEALTLSKSNPIGNVIATILLAIAEMENHYKKERSAHALRIAKKNGKGGGRPAGLPEKTKKTAKLVKALYNNSDNNGLTVKEMYEQLGISKSTFYRLLNYENVTLDLDK